LAKAVASFLLRLGREYVQRASLVVAYVKSQLVMLETPVKLLPKIDQHVVVNPFGLMMLAAPVMHRHGKLVALKPKTLKHLTPSY